MANSSLTFTQFVILDFACLYNPLSLRELHGLLGVQKSTTTRLVNPLIEKQFLEKSKSADDGRKYELLITEPGLEIYQKTWTDLSQAIEIFYSQIPEKEKLRIGTSMVMINTAFVKSSGLI